MSGFSVKEVNADISMLFGCLSDPDRRIPSFSDIARKSSLIPIFTTIVSFISVLVYYSSLATRHPDTVEAFSKFFVEEGWYPVGASIVIGFLFFIMSYTNLTLYMTIPFSVREKSLLVKHLTRLVRRVVIIFFVFIGIAAFLTALQPLLSFAIPGAMFVFLFVINLIISLEINRLGMGPVLEKMNKMLSKI